MIHQGREARQRIVGKLNELLEEERSAAENYQKALSKIKAHSIQDVLMEVRKNHHATVQKLCDQVIKYGGEPTQSSGTWGIFSSTMMDAAKFLGDRAAITVLKAGERHGLNKYHRLLQDDEAPALVRRLVSDELIIEQMGHVKKLESLQKKAA